jgi:DNA-directed RNA polymerase specialized sigma24 family protein
VLEATTNRATFTYDPQAKSLRGTVNGPADSWLENPSGNQRLASIDDGRTTYLFDATDCCGTGHAASARTTFVLDPGPIEPVVLVFVAASVEVRDAHRLFLLLIEETDAELVRSLLAAIYHDAALRRRVDAARYLILGDWANYGDLPKEFLDAVMSRIMTRLMIKRNSYHSSYRDQGPVRFGACMSIVVSRDARRAWRRDRPEWLSHELLQIDAILFELAAPPLTDGRLEEVRELISQIPSDETRQVMEDMLEYLSDRESATKRTLSKTTVNRLRHTGRALLQLWVADD